MAPSTRILTFLHVVGKRNVNHVTKPIVVYRISHHFCHIKSDINTRRVGYGQFTLQRRQKRCRQQMLNVKRENDPFCKHDAIVTKQVLCDFMGFYTLPKPFHQVNQRHQVFLLPASNFRCKVKFLGRTGSNHSVFYLYIVRGCQLPCLMHLCKHKRGVACVH